jgi:DNA-binding NarL/FixJ family response regulator
VEKTKVVIADDSSAVRNGLQSILRAYPDIDVVGEATDGLDALAKAKELRPDVILIDAQLPGLSGADATRRIKERWPEVKVLFLTVHTSYIEAATAAGADGYLRKDSGRRELVEAIRRLRR